MAQKTLPFPAKSGEYFIEYYDENHYRHQEKLTFDKRKKAWIGEKDPEFYKENATSWYTIDNSPIE